MLSAKMTAENGVCAHNRSDEAVAIFSEGQTCRYSHAFSKNKQSTHYTHAHTTHMYHGHDANHCSHILLITSRRT